MKKLISKTRYLLALVSLVLLGTNATVAQTETKFSFDTENDLTENFSVAKTESATYKISSSIEGTTFTKGNENGFFYTELGGTKSSTCTLTTKEPIENIENLSFLLASSDGKKTFLTIQISPKSDFSSDVTTIADALIMRPTETEANCGLTTNNAFQQVSFDVESKSGYIKFIFSQGSNQNKNCGIDELVVKTRDLSAPIILADAASIKATQSGVPASVEIDVEGSNLAGSTLTAELKPAVEGLSVKLDNSTITSGSISASVTITYTATENTDGGQTTLILSDGTTTKEVTITYSAKVKPYELQTISEATTWDFSKGISGGVQFTTDEDKAKENVYGDIEGLTFTSEFNAKALAFKGEYPLRSGKTYAQNGTLHFKTSVQGTISVTFSDTGTSLSKDEDGNTLPAAKRYLNINGKNTEYYVQRNGSNDGKKTVTVFVPTGDVVICGRGEDETSSQGVNFYSIEFTPVTSTNITIENETGYRTFASKYPTDWSSVEGVTAYTAKVNGNEVTFEKVTGIVPAGEGLLLKGEDNTYTVPTAKTAATAIDNALVGVTTETEVEGAGIYVLMNGEEGIGFYKTTAESFTIGANTAYLPATVSAARTFIALDGETTGVNAVKSVEATDGKVFDLQGRQVSKPTKGLYIINGKKYIVK